MLSQLNIKNFAIIKEVDLELSQGLNVITGETGAGKSIMIDALNLVLGGRADLNMIRAGEKKATIDAVFTKDEATLSLFRDYADQGLLDEEEDELILSRELHQTGKSTAKLNGRPVPVSFLKMAGEHLIDILNQNQHQSLLNEKNHLNILDSFGGHTLKEKFKDYESIYFDVKKIEKELKDLLGNDEERRARLDYLDFQVESIEKASLTVGEDEILEEEIRMMSNVEKLKQWAFHAYDALNGGSDGVSGALTLLSYAERDMISLSEYNSNFTSFAADLKNSIYVIQDIAHALNDYGSKLEFQPSLLEQKQERLDLIDRLKKKYGNTVEEILQYEKSCKSEIESILNSGERIASLKKELSLLQKELKDKADLLTEARKEAALLLTQSVKKELSHLHLKETVFDVQFEPVSLQKTGQETIRFYITTNKGETPKPLSQVSSGGEISRILLALKTSISAITPIPTLVFDEVDAGIGGNVIKSVAEKLFEISRNNQVICITHAAQIAVFADHHFLIEKEELNGRTVTRITELQEEDQRISEIVRMLNGKDHNAEAVGLSKKLLQDARKMKLQLVNS